MLMLWAPVQFAGYFISRPVGRLIDRVGERAVLLAYYGCMVVVFAGYALIDNVYVLCALFVLDGTFFILAMAQTTYVNRIAPKDEHTATLSAGIAFNHVASVAMPLVGGWLWMLGYQWTFAVGAVAAAASLPIVMRMPRRPAAPAAAA
jgi:MFS family permease